MTFNINGLVAGDGGIGARGGNVQNVVLNGDDSGGYVIAAGNGGLGTTGGRGGSIINFADLGSATGEVVIRTGAGGVGANAGGGNAGTLSFETFNVRGDVNIQLGDGGDGFTSGGKGASLIKGTLTQPEVNNFDSGTGFGTTHMPTAGGPYTARIGTHEAVDFDRDGRGDFVFTTLDTSQLVVLLGNGQRINLSGLRNPEALTVADLNSDGQLDIAVASLDLGAQSGIAVFLSRFENDGGAANEVSPSQDLNRDQQNSFVGFRDVRYSVLPQLQTGDPRVYAATGGRFPVLLTESPIQVSALTAGDFDGDGNTELALVATYYQGIVEQNGIPTVLSEPAQVLMFLAPDVEPGSTRPTGQFYADFGTKGFDSPIPGQSVPPAPRRPFFLLDALTEAEQFIIEATALSTGATHDVVIVGKKGTNDEGFGISTFDYSVRDGRIPPPPRLAGSYKLGEVDTNREVGGDKISKQLVSLKDFTVLDFGENGTADIGVLSQVPEAVLVGIEGNGTGSGTQVSGNGGDQSGNFFDDLKLGKRIYAIKSGDFNADGNLDDLVVLREINPNLRFAGVTTLQFNEGPQAATIISDVVSFTENGSDPRFVFDVYYPNAQALFSPGVAATDLNGADRITGIETVFGLPTLSNVTSVVGLRIKTGDGGSALIGRGGAAGSLGGGSELVEVIDPVTGETSSDLVGTLSMTLAGFVQFTAGNGGNGFSNGGRGGDVNGVSIRYNEDGTGLGVILTSGNGGRGVSGAGGAGETSAEYLWRPRSHPPIARR
jgi:hypothetical protein